jgi:hypothetical protein
MPEEALVAGSSSSLKVGKIKHLSLSQDTDIVGESQTTETNTF